MNDRTYDKYQLNFNNSDINDRIVSISFWFAIEDNIAFSTCDDS